MWGIACNLGPNDSIRQESATAKTRQSGRLATNGIENVGGSWLSRSENIRMDHVPRFGNCGLSDGVEELIELNLIDY